MDVDNNFSYLTDLEEDVLTLITSRDKNYSIKFNGLKRLLNDVHQQKLSRALERLQEDQLIERKSDGGYGINSRMYNEVTTYFSDKSITDSYYNDKDLLEIDRAYSSDSSFPVRSIIDQLIGKYFGKWRFVGHFYSKTEDQGELEWINSENSSFISVKASKGLIEIKYSGFKYFYNNKVHSLIRNILMAHNIVVNFKKHYTNGIN